MSFDKKKGVRLAGVVLSGSLMFSASLPVAAQGPETTQETAAHQTEEKIEKVVFLNTAPSAEDKKQGPYDGQAVHSMEEVLALFGEKEEEGSAKSELPKEETKILVLCGETVLSEEEMQAVNELGLLLMTDNEYDALQKAKEEAEKKEAEEKAKAEAEKKEAEEKAKAEAEKTEADQKTEAATELPGPLFSMNQTVTEEAPVFIWEEAKGIISGLDQSPAQKAEETDAEEKPVTDTEKEEEKTVAEEAADSENSTAADEEEVEDVAEEEVVYTLFALFNDAEIISETADAEAVNALVADQETESEEQQVEIPSVMALPGTDLVGGGTSGVGGGSKPSQSGSSHTGSTSAGSSSSGSSSAGNASTGNTSAGTSANTSTPAAPQAPQNTVPSKNTVIQTGDASNRSLWGLSAGISGAMAAYFAVQWRKLKNALSK